MAEKSNAQAKRELRTPFSENFFIVDRKVRHKFLSVAKAGCTSLKYVAANDDGIDISSVVDNQDIHDVMGYRRDGKHQLEISRWGDPDYVRVAVWRDPVERVLSWYRDKILSDTNTYAERLGLQVQNDWERIIEFLQFELGKADPEWIDEHLRPHSGTYTHHDVDVMVELRDLNDYLKSIGAFVPSKERFNKSKASGEEPTPEQIERIRELYSADYQLLELIKHKKWSKETEDMAALAAQL